MPVKFFRRGFTLIELLLVIGIIAILASIVIVAINPQKQLADGRNARRMSDVNTLLNGIYQYAIDNDGLMPGCLNGGTGGVTYNICTASNCTGVSNGCNLASLTGTYLVGIPTDPQYVSGNDTLYDVSISSADRVTVAAPNAENGVTISVMK